jgi:ABC-type multidrug transport system fused ATPase/permease subunit
MEAPSMNDSGFTTEEKLSSSLTTFEALSRFTREVPFMRLLLIEAMFIGVVTAVLVNMLYYVLGKIPSCKLASAKECILVLPHPLPSIEATPLVLCILLFSIVFLRIIGWALFEVVAVGSSHNLFSRFTAGLAKVRVTFFDEYPTGVVLNRVNDFIELTRWGSVRLEDTILVLSEVLVMALIVSTTSLTVSLIAIPLFLLLFVSINYFSPRIQAQTILRSQKKGILLHRETDALEGTPLYMLYNSTTTLGDSISKAHEAYIKKDLERMFFEALGSLTRNLLVAIYGGLVIGALAISVYYNTVTPVLAGVIITLSLRLSFIATWLSWSYAQLFDSGAQAKRVFEYVDLPSEVSEEGILEKTNSGNIGFIEFVNYSMSYRIDTTAILQNISCAIPKGAHVGIIGRTGAGKSSIVQALFRMVYVQSGDIQVAGTSIFSLPINKSRELFSVVPQDPYLFAGTLRDALDPTKTIEVNKLSVALTKVGLDYPLSELVVEGGKNLSVGERQLICLARAIISEAPIIILDEPTSSVDTITDAKIQSLLRTELKDRTILTIAHRTSTVLDSDLIMQISDGKLVAFGIPKEVLSSDIEAEIM